MNPANPTVVVVDDDPDTLDFLVAYFAMLGFAVMSCPPGPDAPACIAQHHPRLVVLDVQLGDGQDGLDLFHALRADSVTSVVPVIFFTASEDHLRWKLPDYRDRGAYLVSKPGIEQLGALAHRIAHPEG